MSWDARSHAEANALEGIANHSIPSEVRHFLGQVALMALLKKNPDVPFAAPAISDGIRPIGKTHVTMQHPQIATGPARCNLWMLHCRAYCCACCLILSRAFAGA